MKKRLIKLAAISMATMMAVSMVACGSSKKDTQAADNNVQTEEAADAGAEAENTTIANPVSVVSEDEMCQRTGIDLPLPERATDITYSVIENGDFDIAQAEFTLDGHKMYLRACSTGTTSLMESPTAISKDCDISGLNYEWSAGGILSVQNRDAMFNISKEGPGFIAWLDVVPGIIYNLCMEEGADQDVLLNTAEEIFVPMQGEAEGDAQNEETEEVTEETARSPKEVFDELIDDIYATQAGTAGSSERVQAAGHKLVDYVYNYCGNISEESQFALAADKFSRMDRSNDEYFVDNFRECMDAVVEAAITSNPELEEDVTFNQVINGIINCLDGLR